MRSRFFESCAVLPNATWELSRISVSSFGDAVPLEALLQDAGFREVRSTTISRIMRFDATTWLLRGNAMALVGTSAAGKAMDEQERKRVVDAIVSESDPVGERYTNGSLKAVPPAIPPNIEP